jgi:hypothetical protein
MSLDIQDSFTDDGQRDEIYPPYKLARKWPHEVGLSPLNCGNPECGAEAIRKYPCPECGHAPRSDNQTHWGDWSDE